MKYALAVVLLLVPVQDEGMKTSEILAWTARESKKKFVVDDQVMVVFGAKKVALGADTLDAARAYESALPLLRTVGLAAVPLEDGSVRLVPANAAGREQLKVYPSVGDLPKADEFCTLVVTLKHLEAREAHAALISLFNPMAIVPVDNARTILASDYASNLRKLVEIIKQIDVARVMATWRISVAILEASSGEASVPEAFKSVDLAAVTSRSAFRLIGDAFARVDIEPLKQPVGPAMVGQQFQKPPVNDVSLRFGGARPLLVEFTGSLRGEKGPTLERFTVRDDKDQSQVGPRLLETRIELRDNEWIVVGCVPGDKDGTSVVVLAKATPAK